MRKFALFVLFAASSYAQISNPSVTYVPSAPSGSCVSAPPLQAYSAGNALYICGSGGTWIPLNSGSGTFNALTGDTTSTATGGATVVQGLKGVLFCTGFSPTSAQILTLTTASSPNPCWTVSAATVDAAGNLSTPGTVTAGQAVVKQVGTMRQIDGYPSGGGTWQGVWSSGTSYALCQVVSYSGTNYISMTDANVGHTPSSALSSWVSNAFVSASNLPTQADCALQIAFGGSTAINSLIPIYAGNKAYQINLPLTWNSANNQSFVSVIGTGSGHGATTNDMSTLFAGPTFPANQAFFSMPANSTAQLGGWVLSGITLDGNGYAARGIDANALKISRIEHVTMKNFTDTDHWAQIGDPNCSTNCNFQVAVEDMFLAGKSGSPANMATATVSLSGGVPSISLTGGGSYNYPITQAYLIGNGAGKYPCTVMGTMAVTTSGTGPYVITSLTPSGYSGCSGTVYALIPDIAPANYGIVCGTTDSIWTQVVTQGLGQIAGIYAGPACSVRWIMAHPYAEEPVGILDAGSNTWIDPDLDSAGNYQFDCEGTQCKVLYGQSVWNGTNYAGSQDFYASSNSNLRVTGHTCASSQSAGGYATFVNHNGPVPNRNCQDLDDFFGTGTSNWSISIAGQTTSNSTYQGQGFFSFNPTYGLNINNDTYYSRLAAGRAAIGTTNGGNDGELDMGSTALNNSGTASQGWALYMPGTPYTGGIGPLIMMQPAGAAAGTGWSANGTFFGINAQSGFTGNYMRFSTNGVADIEFDQGGTIRAGNYVAMSGSGNGTFTIGSSGSPSTITRNQADSRAALVVNNVNASSTGDIENWQFAGSTKAKITPTGAFDISSGTGGLKIKDQGSCTMAAGTCSAQSLGHTYAAAPNCFANWNGTGTLTGLLKVPSTTTTVTPASAAGTDTAVVNWTCLGN